MRKSKPTISPTVRKLKPLPPTIVEVRQQLLSGSLSTDDSVLAPLVRGNQISLKGETTKEYQIDIKDIDNSIIYYFQNIIKPQVKVNNNTISVPLLYGSPERWKSIQTDGALRDKDGKLMVPLIIFKRVSIEKNRNIGNKLDGNKVQNIELIEVKYNRRNIYDQFSVLTNRIPSKQYIATIIPDYVTLTYECVIFTDYVEQNNKIVEAIQYASDSYWGDLNRFNFRARIDSFTNAVSLDIGEDRMAKTTFNIIMNGYIIPDTINKELSTIKALYSPSQLVINIEECDNIIDTVAFKTSQEIINAVGQTIYLDNNYGPSQNAPDLSLITADIDYLGVSQYRTADIINSPDTAIFSNVTILQTPSGSSLPATSIDDFTFYINGEFINHDNIIGWNQQENNVVLVFNSSLLGFDIDDTDEIVAVGKFV
jgi:hypothetical protein